MRIGKYTAAEVEQKVRRLSKLSTLPFIAANVVELVENPKTSASSLAKLISLDQGLAARILKLANSAYYGFPRRISTINLAIVVLGFNALRDLVICLSVIDHFEVRDNRAMEANRFWKHSVAVGMGARAFARFINYAVPGEVFVAGLLHDIGILVLRQEFPETFQEAVEYSQEHSVPLDFALNELHQLRIGNIGAWLAEGWNLPPQLVRAIQHHREPDADPSTSPLSHIIHLADLVSNSSPATRSCFHDTVVSEQELEARLQRNFNSAEPLSHFQQLFFEELEKVEDFFEMLSVTEKRGEDTLVESDK